MSNLFDEITISDETKQVSWSKIDAAVKGSTTDEREHWCVEALKLLEELHIEKRTRYKLPPMLKVSCSYAPESRVAGTIKGGTMLSSTTESGWTNILVSPEIDDPVEVLSVLLHESVHAITQDLDHRRRNDLAFYWLARNLGLEGKPTGYQFSRWVRDTVFTPIIKKLGGYPHQKVSRNARVKPKDGTRQLKVGCSDCGVIYRTSRQAANRGVASCGTEHPKRCSKYGVRFERWCDDCGGYGDHFTADCNVVSE